MEARSLNPELDLLFGNPVVAGTLLYLHRHGPSYSAKIAAALGVHRSQVLRYLDRMATGGFVESSTLGKSRIFRIANSEAGSLLMKLVSVCDQKLAQRKENPDLTHVIDELVRVMREIVNPAKIILFGSQARGDWTSGSDIDLAMIRDEHSFPGVGAGKVYAATGKRRMREPYELVVLESKDIESGNTPTIYSSIEKEGVVIYERSHKFPKRL